MITYDQFVRDTATGTIFKSRGSRMGLVDRALEEYYDKILAADLNKKSELLKGLISACMKWLKAKQFKKDNKKPNKPNELFIRRRASIVALGDAALHDLAANLTAIGLTNKDKAALHFNQNKLKTLSQPQPQRVPVRPMGQSYQPERSTYLASDKTKPVSGSGVHMIHNDLHNQDMQPLYPDQQPREVRTALAKNINELNDADFNALDAFARTVNLHKDVKYLAKDQRDELIAMADQNGLLCDYDDNPITTVGSRIYAMDKYGNLFCNEKDSMMMNGVLFNHSSFNSGNDVICAGNIVITNGLLITIDNGSGHYKPTRQNLYNCLTVLEQEEVDMTGTTVNLFMMDHNNVFTKYSFSAAKFLSSEFAYPDQGISPV